MSTSNRRSNRPPPQVLPSVWSSEEEGTPRVSAAWITRPRAGEASSGDAVVVRRVESTVLVAVIDALGHGPKAAAIAARSSEYLSEAPHKRAPDLLRGLHETLHGTRGAAALVLLLSHEGVEACSVGNIELRSRSARLPFVLTPGVLGVRLREPKVCTAQPPIADRFVLFSDGISGQFEMKALSHHAPPQLATQIFTSHRHSHDDATIVVVDVE
jgi:negative regulator of sigma-B (phosphoserine phosphatase)